MSGKIIVHHSTNDLSIASFDDAGEMQSGLTVKPGDLIEIYNTPSADSRLNGFFEKFGHAMIGSTDHGWFVSGFSRASNVDHRGYGPTLLEACEDLWAHIEQDEARRGVRR